MPQSPITDYKRLYHTCASVTNIFKLLVLSVPRHRQKVTSFPLHFAPATSISSMKYDTNAIEIENPSQDQSGRDFYKLQVF